MGRNMFGPGRGEWDLDWTGWSGPEPPYHAPVFVLTQAKTAAGSGGVAIAGGAATLNQYLSLGAVDELRLHVVPITLGASSTASAV